MRSAVWLDSNAQTNGLHFAPAQPELSDVLQALKVRSGNSLLPNWRVEARRHMDRSPGRTACSMTALSRLSPRFSCRLRLSRSLVVRTRFSATSSARTFSVCHANHRTIAKRHFEIYLADPSIRRRTRARLQPSDRAPAFQTEARRPCRPTYGCVHGPGCAAPAHRPPSVLRRKHHPRHAAGRTDR